MQTKASLTVDGNWPLLNIAKSKWGTCGTSRGLSTACDSKLYTTIHHMSGTDSQGLALVLSGGANAVTPSQFACWVCDAHKPETPLHMRVNETGKWSMCNFSLLHVRCGVEKSIGGEENYLHCVKKSHLGKGKRKSGYVNKRKPNATLLSNSGDDLGVFPYLHYTNSWSEISPL